MPLPSDIIYLTQVTPCLKQEFDDPEDENEEEAEDQEVNYESK